MLETLRHYIVFKGRERLQEARAKILELQAKILQ